MHKYTKGERKNTPKKSLCPCTNSIWAKTFHGTTLTQQLKQNFEWKISSIKTLKMKVLQFREETELGVDTYF
jgi:hypothetical protein